MVFVPKYDPEYKIWIGTVQRRSRNCVGFGCTGDSEQFRACTQFISKAPSSDSFMVSQWGEWNKFGPCSVSCGGGFQSRTRLCYEKCPGCLCEGPSTEQRYCNTEKCCEWTSWSTWSQCSVTCGEGGYSYRTRQCTCEQCESGEATEQIRCRANVPCKSITKTRVCTFQLIRGEIPVRIC
uniref:PLAC domain-containing protein n=1 Tax=Syphacia muris TaxID=451379 RepID=A0A0N5AHH3_9BILA